MKQKKTYDLTMNDNTEMTEIKETCVDVRNTVRTVESNQPPPKPFANCMKMDKTKKEAVKICVAEIIGTGILMYIGCTGCFGPVNDPPAWQGSLAFGLGVLMAVQTVGHISGAHLNPSVTIASLILELTTIPVSVLYFTSQCLGALFGYALSRLTVPNRLNKDYCVTTLGADVQIGKGFLIEIIATALLVLMICSFWDKRNKENTDSSSIKAGFAVFVLCIAVAPYTGCSMNPARSLAPAIMTGIWDNHYVYWIGPICGSVLSSTLYKFVFWPDNDSSSE